MISTISEITQIWDKCLREIDKNLGERNIFDYIFSGSYINEIRGDTIVVVTNTALASTMMKTKYYNLIKDAVKEVTQSNFELIFISSNEAKTPEASVPITTKKSNFFPDAKLNPKLTFESFVVGDFNREASQAALLIASNPGNMFNPLFIYSHSGLGKTHLMHAIGNHIIENKNPNAKILYITANDFVEEYIKYVRAERDQESMKDFFAGVDVLLLDDVQFLAEKVKTQEMFFFIFTKMIDNGKQIVITSDRQPSELNNQLEDRLVTRFSQGLTVKIDEPDQNTCVEILRKKIVSSNLSLDRFDDSVLYFYADKFSKNLRELEGALNRLIFYVVSLKQADKITMDVAVEAVQSLIGGKAFATQLNEQKIINVVADYYNLTPSQLTGKIRTGQVAMARHIAMYLIRFKLDISLKKIGDMFGGKDHTTVISAIEKVEKELKTNDQLKAAIKELEKRIGG